MANYLKLMTRIYEEAAENIISTFKLEPNFDIIDLLNKLEIETIQVEKLPKNWEYAFNDENGNLKLFYVSQELNEFIDTDYLKRDLRFLLAYALADILFFYGRKEENLIKIKVDNNTYCQGAKRYLNTWREKDFECEHFAACLLMPRENLKEKFYDNVIDDKISFDAIYRIGESFGVNAGVICRRCRKLSLIRY